MQRIDNEVRRGSPSIFIVTMLSRLSCGCFAPQIGLATSPPDLVGSSQRSYLGRLFQTGDGPFRPLVLLARRRIVSS